MRHLIIGFALICIIICAGCAPKTSSAPAAPSYISLNDLSFQVFDGAGKPFIAVSGKNPTFEVTQGEKKVATLQVNGAKFQLRDTAGLKMDAVKRNGEDVKLEDVRGAKIAKLSPKEGGYRLKDAAGAFLVKIKPKDDKFKVSDGKEAMLAKIKVKGDKIILSNEQDKVLFTVTGKVDPQLTGLLMARTLTPVQQVAMIVAAHKP